MRVLGQKKLANFFMIWKSCFWFTKFQHLVVVMRGRVLWRCRDRDGCGEAEDALGSLGSLEEGGEKAEIVLVFVCVTLRLDNTFKNNKYLLRV